MRTRSAVDTLPSAPPPFPATARAQAPPSSPTGAASTSPCRSEIENGKILYLADKSKDWQTLGLRFAQLRFTTESASECVRVLRAYQGETVEAPENITRGLFYRGAE